MPIAAYTYTNHISRRFTMTFTGFLTISSLITACAALDSHINSAAVKIAIPIAGGYWICKILLLASNAFLP